jgi:predicted RNase H-like nuclease (RuvC/YqgF family)
MSKKTKKPKKKLTKAQLNKWRKETNACEHDKVGYQALMRLANGMFERSKEDAWNIQKLSEVLKTQNETAKESKRGFLVIIDRYEDQIKELEKKVEELTIQRNESTRAYNGLSQMGKFAEQMGIDLQSAQKDLPEAEKNKYDFKQTDTLMESGKVKHIIKLTPKKKDN